MRVRARVVAARALRVVRGASFLQWWCRGRRGENKGGGKRRRQRRKWQVVAGRRETTSVRGVVRVVVARVRVCVAVVQALRWRAGVVGAAGRMLYGGAWYGGMSTQERLRQCARSVQAVSR